MKRTGGAATIARIKGRPFPGRSWKVTEGRRKAAFVEEGQGTFGAEGIMDAL